jgi:hypothetical protein
VAIQLRALSTTTFARSSTSWRNCLAAPKLSRELSSESDKLGAMSCGGLLALFAFDKAKLGDIWYDRATRESEANVDQWRRENPEWRGEVNE